jgi:putative transposase
VRSLNEYVACRADRENDCTAPFGEALFGSQALLGEAALLTAMSYVDLNPIRAKMADSIENSDFTSAQERWRGARPNEGPSVAAPQPRLLPFIEAEHERAPDHLPFNLQDYLDLLETTGRNERRRRARYFPYSGNRNVTFSLMSHFEFVPRCSA